MPVRLRLLSRPPIPSPGASSTKHCMGIFFGASLEFEHTTSRRLPETFAMAYYPPPAWVAAANPDVQDLRALIHDAMTGSLNDPGEHHMNQETEIHELETPAMTEYGEWVSTPLLRAIKHNNVEHVRAMLEAGVEPNGVTIRDLLRFAIRMSADDPDLREMLEEMDEGDMINRLQSSQQRGNPMIDREISRYRDAGNASPFWGHPASQFEQPYGEYDIIPERDVDMWGNLPMSSITVAAWCGQPQIIDLLLAQGADTTSWLRGDHNESRTREFKPTCSELSLITPLHAAIGRGQTETIRYLLKRGLSPNATRSIAPDGATSALQYSIITRWKTGSSAFEILAEDARSDFSLRTPYLQVSSLHLAVATLDRQLVEQVMTHGIWDNFSTNLTALGHTVLHIACLPGADADIKFKNSPTGPAAQESIHHCRGISPMTGDGRVVDFQAQYRLQGDMVKFLLEQQQGNTALLMQPDVFGNTPLHYLAAVHQPNVDLLTHLRGGNSQVLEAWNSCINEKGYSPRALYGTNGE